MRKLLSDENGQAVVEYILMVSLAVMAIGIIGVGFRKIVMSLWQSFFKDVAAACPSGNTQGCPSPI